jgi:gamma-glutamyltranspeptidase/glutathione hydrolase
MGGGLVPGQFPPPESMRPTLVGDRWAVVAGHPIVSQVAAEVLAAGGNAVDAGVAAGLATNVVQVDMANFGGIAPILVRAPNDAGATNPDGVFSVAGVGRWSTGADLAEILERHQGALPLGGVPSIVPAAPAAWIAALRRFGTWSFTDVAAPAVELARHGFPLDHRTAVSLEIAAGGFSRWPSSARIYTRDGKPFRAGERLVQTELADLLSALADAESGASREDGLAAVHDAFYKGEIASRICDFVQERAGSLMPSDLARFAAEVAPAPSVAFGDWRVFATPSWSQGPVVLETLALLAGQDLSALSHNGSEHLHLLTELLGLAFADRETYLGDPEVMAVTLDGLLAPPRLDALRALVGERALPREAARGVAVPQLGSTTSIVVSDVDGTTFAASPSDTLDGAPIIPGLGIVCSPRGVQSRLVPDHANALRPGRRPCVTPTAAIAVREGRDPADVWALACPGGDVIVQAIVQVICNVESYGQTLQQAVEAPRIAAFNEPSAFHPHPRADNVVYVEGRIAPDVRADLAARGHDVITWPDVEFDAGSVQTTMVSTADDGGRIVQAAADPRRSAYGIVR